MGTDYLTPLPCDLPEEFGIAYKEKCKGKTNQRQTGDEKERAVAVEVE